MNDTPLVLGVNVVAIYVSDLDRAKHFYTQILGLQESNDMPPGILLSAGDFTIYLEGGRKGNHEPGMTLNTVSPCFSSASIRNAYNVLKEQGIHIVEDYVEYTPQFAMFRCADPDGNVLEFAGMP